MPDWSSRSSAQAFKCRYQIIEMIDHRICAQIIGRRIAKAKAHRHNRQPSRARCACIKCGIAHKRCPTTAAALHHRVEHIGARLGRARSQRVATDHAGKAMQQAQFLEQAHRKAFLLVRGNRDFHAQRIQRIEHVRTAREQRRVLCDVAPVKRHQLGLKPVKRGLVHPA
jgi:ferredoxin